MPRLIESPSIVEAVGNKPKVIREYIGRVNSSDPHISVAHMVSPAGWVEPGQAPDFQELTVVLKGMLHVEHEGGVMEVASGQAIISDAREWVRYSSPVEGGAEYIAICLPAFAPELANRDAE